jgi:lipoprotein-releasing system permease protein
MGLSYLIAWRFLTSTKTQTLLIICGITVGVAVQVFLGSLIFGLQTSLVDTTIGRSSHIVITSDNFSKTINKPQVIMSEIETFEEGVKNLSFAVDSAGFVSFKSETLPVLVRGFSLQDAERIYGFQEFIYEGRMPQKVNEIIVGKDLAQEIGVQVEDFVFISSSAGNRERVRVTGLYDFKVAAINQTWLVTPAKTVQNIFGFGNRVTSIEMQLEKVFSAQEIAQRLETVLSEEDLILENWMDQNEQLLSGLRGQSVSSYMIQFFVLVAVTLGIASVLAVSVVQKSKQIGILKAIGIKDQNASAIFLFQGLLLGVVGSILGIFSGYALLTMFTTFARNPDGTPVVPILINVRFIVISAIIAVMVSVVASFVPAKYSSRLSPIEVIRNG